MAATDEPPTARIGHALWAAPEGLLELLGDAGAALRYNPGHRSLFGDPFEHIEPCWEVFEISGDYQTSHLVGYAETPLQALIDAAINLLGWDREEDTIVIDSEVISVESVRALRKAINAADKFLRECNLDEALA